MYADQRITLVPTIRVNPAIRVYGYYNIGGIRNRFNQSNSGMGIAPFERYGQVSTNTGSQDTWGIGSWEQFRATVTTPWGIITYGMKDFPIGLGRSPASGQEEARSWRSSPMDRSSSSRHSGTATAR